MNGLQRRRSAVQVQPWEGLGVPVSAEDARDSLNQLLALGLRPLRFALRLLGVHRTHTNLAHS